MGHRKWFVRIIAIFLAVLMAGTVLFSFLGSVSYAAPSQGAVDNLKSQQSTLEQKKKELEAQINSIEYEQADALAKKAVLDEKVALTEQEIENITAQIETYKVLIEEKAQEVIEAQKAEEEQWELYQTRIRAMEENGKVSYFEILFGATSFSDFLSRIDFIGEIMDYDEQLYEDLVAAREATVAAKEALEEAKAEQEATKAELENKKAELDTQVAEADALVQQLESSLEEYEALYAEADAATAELQREIDDMIAELKRQEEATGGTNVSSTGTFVWPSDTCRIVTSKFGTRMHPVYHVYKTHNGIDIGARYGTNVLAADSGTVVVSKYSSSYGNYIMINHGNGTTTLYAHMSSRIAQVGDKVSQGEVIGLVGSTGVSTGAHIHFEITVGGSRVNPLNYFSNYTFSSGAW